MFFRKLLFIDEHVCPWWLAPTFDNPLRWLIQNPYRILSGFVQQGQTVADIGCGMGYFSIPLAHIVGAQGKVIATDLQDEMLQGVRRRAIRAGVQERLVIRQAQDTSLGLAEQLDFALAFWMVHEVPDPVALLGEIHSHLIPGGGLLIAEPVIHVSEKAFQKTVDSAALAGLSPVKSVKIRLSRATFFLKST